MTSQPESTPAEDVLVGRRPRDQALPRLPRQARPEAPDVSADPAAREVHGYPSRGQRRRPLLPRLSGGRARQEAVRRLRRDEQRRPRRKLLPGARPGRPVRRAGGQGGLAFRRGRQPASPGHVHKPAAEPGDRRPGARERLARAFKLLAGAASGSNGELEPAFREGRLSVWSTGEQPCDHRLSAGERGARRCAPPICEGERVP